jgi:hypothetical protein
MDGSSYLIKDLYFLIVTVFTGKVLILLLVWGLNFTLPKIKGDCSVNHRPKLKKKSQLAKPICRYLLKFTMVESC